jgi:DNA repair protein RadC
MAKSEVRERIAAYGARAVSDAELLTALGAAADSTPISDLAWLSVGELRRRGLTEARAVRLAAAFELGRRGAWSPPRRGQRCLDPRSVYELMRPLAYRPVEEFHVVLLDVRARLLKTECCAQGSVSECPVAPREVFRVAVREGAHGVIFVHSHPSGAASPSAQDDQLTARLRAAADVVGVVARDHVIVAMDTYYSYVEAGRWRR